MVSKISLSPEPVTLPVSAGATREICQVAFVQGQIKLLQYLLNRDTSIAATFYLYQRRLYIAFPTCSLLLSGQDLVLEKAIPVAFAREA